jgi:predicted ABC-type ATPase
VTVPLPEPSGSAYPWPPLPILDPDEAADALAERLGMAYDDLEAMRLRLQDAALAGADREEVGRWIVAFQTALARFLDDSAAHVQAFLTLHLGPRYQAGAVDAAGDPDLNWTLAHQAALTSLAVDTYQDFLQRALEARRVSEAFVRAIRKAAAEEIPKIAAGGRTAVQVGRQLEAQLTTRYGVDVVTYRNGAEVPVRVYAQMVARTKSAVAYNSGSLNEWAQEDVGYVEVFDGAACGWTDHDDEDKANGTVRSVLEASRHMLGHPNCRRAFGARPDITSDEEAANAEPSTTAEQREDQAQSERDQLVGTTRRAAQRRRDRLAEKRAARLAAPTSEPAAPVVEAPGLTDDVVGDMAGGSAAPHIVKIADGRWGFTPERAALHDSIVEATLAGVEPQENPRYSLMGGGPAAGKSTMEGQVPEISQGAALVNADEVKAALPEYDQITDGSAAAFTHEESSYVAKRIVAEGFRRRVNVTLDGTGNGRPDDLRAKLDQAREAGYEVNGYYVTVDTDVAVARATARGEATGRVVPETIIRNTHQKVSAALPSVLDDFDAVAIYDNNVEINLIAQKLPGQPFEILDAVAWEKFLRKGDR